MLIKNFRGSFAWACAWAMLTASGAQAAQTSEWDLMSAAKRVIDEAPQRAAAESQVRARQGGLDQAGRWSNPTLELGASNAMGKEDGKGGTDLNQITLKQALPISGRIGLQKQQAEAALKQAEALSTEQQLDLEHEAARVFHRLQLMRAQYRLAEQQLSDAEEIQHIGQRREQAGDISRLERLRLDLVREHAKQSIAASEGKVSEAESDFRTSLNLTAGDITLLPLDELPILPDLQALEANLAKHPTLQAAAQGVTAADHNVALARASRLVDPEVWVTQGRDYLGGERQDTTAFGVSVTLPLWDRNRGNIAVAQAERDKVQFEQAALQRQLGSRLRLNHLHLGHLIEQAKDYRRNVLEPAEQVFQLSRHGFVAGEVEILGLVDAVERFYESRNRYLELVDECWLEAAELRRSAGISLFDSQLFQSKGAVQ